LLFVLPFWFCLLCWTSWLITQWEQSRPTMQTCLRTCSLHSFLQDSILSFDTTNSYGRYYKIVNMIPAICAELEIGEHV
jgi:hypothetical protein